jgi:tetratricopeptide (TPR) repeat protein
MSRPPGRRWATPTAALLLSIAFGLVAEIAGNTVQAPASWGWWPWLVWTVVVVLVVVSVWARRAQPWVAALDRRVIADLAARFRRDWSDEAVRREVTRPAPVPVSWNRRDRFGAGVLDEQIAGTFRKLPERQLLVLGEPGAGKSVFALLLTLALIETRSPREPVPLLLAINAWDPAEPIAGFLARRLAEDYAEVLARRGEPRSTATLLVEQEHLLPILDGLDELPAERIGPALHALDAYAAAKRPLVVTCRTSAYEQAVEQSEAVLTSAAVIELEPVGVDTAIAYLSHPRPARRRWAPVFARLQDAAARDPLAAALTTPLMISLARTAYRDPATDPAELLGLPTRHEITGRLMDAFLAAAYPADVARARRRLSVLAYQLYLAGTRDLHWWQLERLVRPRVGTGGFMRVLWPYGYPPHPRWTFRVRRRDRVAPALLYGLGAGALTGVVTGAWAAALAAGLLCALLAVLVPAWQPPPPHHGPGRADPELAHNRRIVAATALQAALSSGALFTLAALAVRVNPLAPGLTAALICGGIAGLVTGGGAWIRFRLTHARLALRGRLPWQRNAYLVAAHDRGVLRRAGPVYQFRHAILQDHLAAAEYERDLRHGAGTGDWAAAGGLAALLAERGQIDEAIALLQSHAERGVSEARVRLNALLAAQGRAEELRARAATGDRDAILRLVDLLAERGEIEEAVAVLEPRIDVNWQHPLKRAVQLLVADGQTDRALRLWHSWPHLGETYLDLPGLLIQHGRIDELRAEADRSSPAAERLARWLADRGKLDELRARADAGDLSAAQQLTETLDEDELRARVRSGNRPAVERLARVLAHAGRTDEAIELLREHDLNGEADNLETARLAEQGNLDELRAWSDGGVWWGTERLVELLVGAGRVEEALDVLRPMAVPHRSHVVGRYLDLLVQADRVDEVRRYLRRTPGLSSSLFVEAVAGLERHGHVEVALELLRRRAGAQRHTHALAKMLAKHGRVVELRARADAGDIEAVFALARVLAEAGQVEEAIGIVRTRADAGRGAAAMMLANLLAQHGRIDELRARAAAGDEDAARHLIRIEGSSGQSSP